MFYSSKLEIKFEEDNIIEYYPNIKIWINDGVLSPDVSFYKEGYSKVSCIVKLVMEKMSNGAFKLEKRNKNILEVSEIDILDGTPLIDIKPYIPRFDNRENANNGWVETKEVRPKPLGRE